MGRFIVLTHSCIPGTLDFLAEQLLLGPTMSHGDRPGGLVPGWSGPAGVARPLLITGYVVQPLFLPEGEAARPFTVGVAALLLSHASCVV
jgi:hypothetical protein